MGRPMGLTQRFAWNELSDQNKLYSPLPSFQSYLATTRVPNRGQRQR